MSGVKRVYRFLDGVHRIRHGYMHHCQAARPRVTGDVDGFHDVDGGLIPVGDDVGAGLAHCL